MEKRTWDMLRLIFGTEFGNQLPFKASYENFMKAPPIQRMQMLYLLLGKIDPPRALNDFNLSVKREETVKITNVELFKQQIYEFTADIEILCDFEIPSKADFCSTSPKNQEMFYYLAKYVLSKQNEELLNNDKDFKLLGGDKQELIQTLKEQMYLSAEEFKGMKILADSLNEVGRVKKIEKIKEKSLNTEEEQAFNKINYYVEKISNLEPRTLAIDEYELMNLEEEKSQDIILENVFLGIENLLSFKLQDLNVKPPQNDLDNTLAKLSLIQNEALDIVEQLQEEYETHEIQFLTQECQNVKNLELKHFSQLNLSELPTTEIVESGINYSVTSDNNEEVSITSIDGGSNLEVKDLTIAQSEAASQKNTLAQRLKLCRFTNCDEIRLIAGQTEGVREKLIIE